MTVHVFICPKDSKKFGLTQQKTNPNLPANACKGASWQFFKTLEIFPNTDLFLLPINADTLISLIEREGFCVISTSISIELSE